MKEIRIKTGRECGPEFVEGSGIGKKMESAHMNKKEFSKIRRHFGKSQLQISQLLGVSLKAVQSFEQGWRKIPVHVERQLLFLLALKQNSHRKVKPCWEVLKCPKETRIQCPAWEFKAGHYCWSISGTICRGKVQDSWQKKMNICTRCKVFQKTVSL